MDTFVEQILAGLTPIVDQAVTKAIDRRLKQNIEPDAISDLCLIDSASAMTGKSKQTFYTQWKKIPGARKHGKRLYFSKQGLMDWINGKKNEPVIA